jgi:hypothetical protein
LIARAAEVLMKDAKENRYLLHSILRKIQELIAVTRTIQRRSSLRSGATSAVGHDLKSHDEHISSALSPMARRLRIVGPRDHAPQGKIASYVVRSGPEQFIIA